ncbi:hypothetical protein D5086_000797 [Populus alba]|uniref:Uncharacterized protein n=1 Tax=Populus alba TaxID=43335 RepID=A0ACC4CY28_POPAL
MEITAFDFALSQYFLIASSLTLLSLLLAFLTLRSKSPKPDLTVHSPTSAASTTKTITCRCCCSCNEEIGSVNSTDSYTAEEKYLNGGGAAEEMVVEKQTGASMMEQLVPEITTHALSYLDYPSLCRLSMTNSLMRKAANDDNAWKALYHKDFTLEQDSVTPVNGWKAYYAATRAIVNVNTEFFNIIRERSLQAMSQLWLHADYVKCTHASGENFSGYNAVIQSWQFAFNWEQGLDFQVRDVRARVLTDMAWVTMKMYVVEMDNGPFNVTNVFELHNGRWHLVHHHCSVMVLDGEVDQQIIGCKGCGREEIEKGCNGEGRIQGGIATVPGFGWWPIKAYRPCPGFLASGGRYRRQGQSMDEVAFGREQKETPVGISGEGRKGKIQGDLGGNSLESDRLDHSSTGNGEQVEIYIVGTTGCGFSQKL